MTGSSINRQHLPVLLGSLVTLVSIGVAFGISSGDPLVTSIVRGIALGGSAFILLALLYFAVVLGSSRQIRLLQGLFLALVVAGIGTSVIQGDSVVAALVRGSVIGGLTFVPSAALLSALFVAYWYGKQRSVRQIP